MSRVRIHPNPQQLGEYISIIAKVRHIVTMSATTTTVQTMEPSESGPTRTPQHPNVSYAGLNWTSNEKDR